MSAYQNTKGGGNEINHFWEEVLRGDPGDEER